MDAIDAYLRLEGDVRRSHEIDKATPITDEVIEELLARWSNLKAWQVFDLMRGCIARIRLDAEVIEAARESLVRARLALRQDDAR